MKYNLRTLLFILVDYLISVLSWTLFYFARKTYIEHSDLAYDIQFFKGIIVVPIFWILIYTFQGTYIETKRLYRSKIIVINFIGTIIGTSILFFFVLIDDKINSYENYYSSFTLLFFIQFSLSTLSRVTFTSIQVSRIQNLKDSFQTIIIGKEVQIVAFEKELNSLKKSLGNKITSIVLTTENTNFKEFSEKKIIEIDKIHETVKKDKIEEVIIVDDEINPKELQHLLSRLSGLGVSVKVKASDFDIATGTLKQNNLFGLLIKEINFDTMPFWQKSMKRFIDLLISIFSLIILTPLFLLISIGVKRSSKGPIFFKQERIGKNGIPFKIIKFRTMYIDSEKNGPQLSSTHDNRITSFGKFLRKTRIDEFPQFINVIKGEMSLVGPRPERKFYIDQISKIDPSFLQLTIVKPGITSWGQVKFGYAENVDQMIQRMRFDLLYLKNRSLALDFKIMFYTIITIIKAKGK